MAQEIITEAEQTELGQAVIALLNLHVKPNGCVDTNIGEKTPRWLGATIERLTIESHWRRGPMYLEIYQSHPNGLKVFHLLMLKH